MEIVDADEIIVPLCIIIICADYIDWVDKS